MSSMDDQRARQQYLQDERDRITRRDQWIEDRAYVIAGWIGYLAILTVVFYALAGFMGVEL